MKWSYEIFLFCALFLFIKSKAQLDTLNYLKQFEANKANYVGQPFSKLLNDMTQIQPKTVWSHTSFNNKKIILSTDFKFVEKDYSYGNSIKLLIKWQNPLLESMTSSLAFQNNCYFTSDEKAFYGSKIIQDIHVYR